MNPVDAPATAASLVNSPQTSAPSHSGHGKAAYSGPTAFADAYASALAGSTTYPSAATVHEHGGSSLAAPLPAIPPSMQETSSPFRSAHIPLPGHGSGDHDFQERALGLLAYRQQVLASNIANFDTPGYKAVDFDVPEALRSGFPTTGKAMPMTTTASGHTAGQAALAGPPLRLKYHVPHQASVDGNTVEMDVERTKFAENAIRYEFALDQAVGHYKHMAEMLKDLK